MGSALIFAVAAAVAIIGWRGVRAQHRKVSEALKQAEAALNRRAGPSAVTLEKDPKTGVYRPKQ